MRDINKAILIGRLGTDPELRYSKSGGAVTTFPVGTGHLDKEENKKTEWHSIVVWGKRAENCHLYLKKGSQVYVEGRINTRSWDDKEGIKKYKTEILANNVQFLGGLPKPLKKEDAN